MTAPRSDPAARERHYSWQDPREVARPMATLSGLEYLRKMATGEIRAPIQDTLGFSLVEIGEGFSRWSLAPKEFHYNPGGSVHGGVLSTLLDSAMSIAIWSVLPKGSSWTTLELKVNFIRPMTRDTGPVVCESKLIHAGRQTGTAEGRVIDASGKLYAHGSTTCMIVRPAS